jgi:hypothetical protein
MRRKSVRWCLHGESVDESLVEASTFTQLPDGYEVSFYEQCAAFVGVVAHLSSAFQIAPHHADCVHVCTTHGWDCQVDLRACGARAV